MSEKKKIIIIDDDRDFVTFLTVFLEDNGYDTVAAYDGLEGIEKTRSERPDLVLLDITMPEKSGVAVYRALKEDERLKNIPVIMLSAIERKTFLHYLKFFGSTPRLDSSEPEAYLEKPPETEELLGLVQRLTQTQLSDFTEDE